MYGSSFCIRTRNPLASSNIPIDALVNPLPIELTTPPVTNMCLVMTSFQQPPSALIPQDTGIVTILVCPDKCPYTHLLLSFPFYPPMTLAR